MLDEYEEAIEAFASAQLDPYSGRITEMYAGRHASGKDFNDPVWGTLALSALEVLVLDSPLLQRLRFVRQLGVAHLVYPSAGHTRFEHSVGALHMTQRLIAAASESPEPLPEKYSRLLRLAALCHDVGHCVMSHVAENALAYIDEAEDLRGEFGDKYKKGAAALGEINSYLLLGTDAFGRLLTAAGSASGVGLELPQPQQVLQKLVLGAVIDPEYPNLHQIITGPFDADKLDYMTRDAFMSGVPLVTDVNRLIRKVRCIRISRTSAPRVIQNLTTGSTDTIAVIGIDRSGNRTLDELTFGRTLLFDKIYRHQKTRAAEAMVAAMLTTVFAQAADQSQVPAALMGLLELTDDELLRGDLATSHATLAMADATLDVVNEIATRLRSRQLFMRAVEFSRKMTDDSYDKDDVQARGLQELMKAVEAPVGSREICKEIAVLATEALVILGRQHVADQFPGPLSSYIWLDAARSGDHLTASSKAMLVVSDNRIVPFEDEAPETTQWARAYHQTRECALIFCPEEMLVEVTLAAEKYLRLKYGVRLPALALLGSRRSPTGLADERSILAASGFYDDSPADLRPPSQRLSAGDAEGIVATIASRLHGYFPPLVDLSQAGRDQFSPRLVNDFVSQFEEDDMIDAALSIFSEVQVIDRMSIVRPVLDFIDANPSFASASLVVFGSGADSSSVATYYAKDAVIEYPDLTVRDLPSALSEPNPILFVDDLIGSGRQAGSIVRAWFGDMDLANELGEQRITLPDEMQVLLRNRSLGFCFATSVNSGLVLLEEAFAAHDIRETSMWVGREPGTIPNVFKSGDLDPDLRARFIERCRSIGDELLQVQPESKRFERVLGYGNYGLLLAFPYNTPSHTLTCLWERGIVAGKVWTPLLPRRRKT